MPGVYGYAKTCMQALEALMSTALIVKAGFGGMLYYDE